mgnify:FL=1
MPNYFECKISENTEYMADLHDDLLSTPYFDIIEGLLYGILAIMSY